jgi:hypothetical protein
MRWSLLRFGLFALIGVLAMGLPTVPSHSAATATAAPGKKSADLREMLEAGLKARRPEEFAFIKRVVAQVQTGELPQDLVRSTFDWARYKRPYPFPYFERGLKVRAAQRGIVVQ